MEGPGRMNSERLFGKLLRLSIRLVPGHVKGGHSMAEHVRAEHFKAALREK